MHLCTDGAGDGVPTSALDPVHPGEPGDGSAVDAPSPVRPALERCVAIPAADFAVHHWGREPLLTRAGDLPSGFSDLLDLAAVDELLSRRGLRTPFLRIAKDGTVVPQSRYTGRGGAGAEVADQVLDERVLELFADGSTVVLQGLHRMWPPVVDFTTALAAELGHPVQANAYVTPPQSRGFSAHYDVHDVFVLQLAGSKRWVIHAPVHRDPLRSQPWTDFRSAVATAARDSDPLIDTVLDAGDCLYLPRGFLHSAQALGGVSAHLTVGIHTVTCYGLAEAMLQLAKDDPDLRSSLPMNLDLSDAQMLQEAIGDTVAVLVSRLRALNPEHVVRQLRSTAWPGSRPAPLAPLAQAAALRELDPDSRVRWRPGLRVAVERGSGADATVLDLLGRRVSLEGPVRQAVDVLVSGTPVRVGDLPGLPADAAVDLAARLLRDGVLVPAPA